MSEHDRSIYLACDIDMTLQAGDWHPEDQPIADQALTGLMAAIMRRRQTLDVPFYVGTVSGRTLASQREVERSSEAFQHSVEQMDILIGSVGAEIAVREEERFTPLEAWPGALSGWDRAKAYALLDPKVKSGELELQEAITQSDNKLSFFATPQLRQNNVAQHVEELLAQEGVAATVIFSGGRYLDILPRMENGKPIHKGAAVAFGATLLAEQDNLETLPQIIFAGDSENDEDGFAQAIAAGGFGIIPANAKETFKQAMRERYSETQLSIARTARFALAIHEALLERGVLLR